MGKRITIVFDDELIKKLRIIQSKKIAKSECSVSFSRVVNDVVRDSLKNMKKNLSSIIHTATLSAIFTGICASHGIEHSFHSIDNLI